MIKSSKPVMLSAALFALVGFIAVSLWALKIPALKKEIVLYSAISIVFILGGAPSLLPAFQANNPDSNRLKFCLLFFGGFIAFATLWSLLWFQFRDQKGEIFGSFLGLMALLLVFKISYQLNEPLHILLAKSFTAYTIPYYLGEYLHGEFMEWGTKTGVTLSRLAWGLCIGIGLGSGLALIAGALRSKQGGESVETNL